MNEVNQSPAPKAGILEGKKTYLTAVAMMATGLGLMLKSFSEGQGLSVDGLETFMMGMGFLFTRRAIAKQ